MCRLFSVLSVVSVSDMSWRLCVRFLCITDFKDVFTPEAANATAYSNNVVGTNTWQWWNKERGEWGVYAITVAAKQPPVASITSPAPPSVKPAPQPEQTESTDATAAVSQMPPAAAMQEPKMEVQTQPQQPTQPPETLPQTQTQAESTSTPPAIATADHDQQVLTKEPVAAEQAPAAVSLEELAAAGPAEPVMAG